MILIVEGQDRCGKSKLITNLRKHYFTNPKLIVHHSSAPPKGVADSNSWEVDHYRETADTFHHLSAKQGYDVICDRFHLGAIVYGTRYRGLNPYTIYSVDAQHVAKGNEKKIALVLLTDSSHAIMSREDGNSIEISSLEYDQTREEFIRAFKYSVIPHKIHINITENGGLVNTYQTVVDFLNDVRSEDAESC
jgi:thymidylate kinase